MAVVNLLIEYVEEKAMSEVTFSVKFCRCFVDGMSSVLCVEHVNDFHCSLNIYIPVKFTSRLETKTTLLFLDMCQ